MATCNGFPIKNLSLQLNDDKYLEKKDFADHTINVFKKETQHSDRKK